MVAAVIWSIIDLWHSKQNDSTVFFSIDIYLLVICIFLKAIAFFGGQAGLKVEKWALIGILPYERNIVFVLLAYSL